MLKVTIDQVKQGIEQYHGKSWLFAYLRAGGWQNGDTSSRITIDDLDINVYVMDTVIGLSLWYSNTAQVSTYIGHPIAIDLEIEKLYTRLLDNTNYVYERESKASVE